MPGKSKNGLRADPALLTSSICTSVFLLLTLLTTLAYRTAGIALLHSDPVQLSFTYLSVYVTVYSTAYTHTILIVKPTHSARRRHKADPEIPPKLTHHSLLVAALARPYHIGISTISKEKPMSSQNYNHQLYTSDHRTILLLPVNPTDPLPSATEYIT